MSILIKLHSSNILTSFVQETAELAKVIIESKTDNGRIGPVEWFRIFQESLDVVALFDDLKGHGIEFSQITNGDISTFSLQIKDELELSESTVLKITDIIHILYLIRSLSGLITTVRH